MDYTDLAATVTARLVARIEAGAGAWRMPWHDTPGLLDARNAATGVAYRGANTVALAVAAMDGGFPSGWWATYRQWARLGAQVRRGQTAARVVKWVAEHKRRRRGRGGPVRSTSPAPGVPVFNAAQVDGWAAPAAGTVDQANRDERADAWVTATGAEITYGHNHACYRPALDRIELPSPHQFHEPAAYYATVCHELTHWTGHPSRLARDLTGRFGDNAYAAEELVAELGAALACAHLAIPPTPRDDHATYLAHWLAILNADPKALFTVAAKAQAALDYLDHANNTDGANR